MVVCVCNAIRESQVRECARAGCATSFQVHQTLGLPPKCGQCAKFARTIIDAERAAA